MLKIIRTNSENENFKELVKKLDAYLRILDGDEHEFYAQLNKTEGLKHVVVVYFDKIAVGCGAMKEYSQTSVEIKRMYVSPEFRGKAIATKILNELEKWALELSFGKCILETGKRQADAIALYQKNGYQQILNYGKYVQMENSVCFEKVLR